MVDGITAFGGRPDFAAGMKFDDGKSVQLPVPFQRAVVVMGDDALHRVAFVTGAGGKPLKGCVELPSV